MLVLSRRVGESVMIGSNVRVTVVEARGDQIRLGIDAPRSIAVHREEVFRQVQDANAAAEKRRWMGPMRYDVSIVLELLKIGKRKIAPCRLTIDGTPNEVELFVITIMNNKHSVSYTHLRAHET